MTRLRSTFQSFQRGLTLVEVLMSLAAGAVLLAVVSPSLETSAIRTEVETTTSRVSQAFHIARETARLSGTPVTLSFTDISRTGSIRLSYADGTSPQADGMHIPPLLVGGDVRLTASPDTYTFAPVGIIERFDPDSRVQVESTLDSAYRAVVRLSNGIGHVEVDRTWADAPGAGLATP